MLKYRAIISVKTVMSVEKYGWAIQKSLFAWTNQDSTFSHTYENLKMFNIIQNILAFLRINHLQDESGL